MKLLTERYRADLLGALSCYDRMIVTGTLPGACYAGGMTGFLYSRHIKIFDYAKVFAGLCARASASTRTNLPRRMAYLSSTSTSRTSAKKTLSPNGYPFDARSAPVQICLLDFTAFTEPRRAV